MLEFFLGRKKIVEVVEFDHGTGALAPRVRVGQVVEEVLDQILGLRGCKRRLAVVDQTLDLPVKLAEQQLDRDARLDRAVLHAFGHGAGNPPQPARGVVAAAGVETFEDARDACERRRGRGFAYPAQQRMAVVVAQAARVRTQDLGMQRLLRPRRQFRIDVGRKQHRLAEQSLAARRAQIVEQRQQNDRDVLVAALQALDVVRQLQEAAHQHRINVLARRDTAFGDAARDALHLLGHECGAVELDHVQRAVRRVQAGGAFAHGLRIGRIVGIALERVARFFQCRIELGLDPAERREIGFLSKIHRRRAIILPAA